MVAPPGKQVTDSGKEKQWWMRSMTPSHPREQKKGALKRKRNKRKSGFLGSALYGAHALLTFFCHAIKRTDMQQKKKNIKFLIQNLENKKNKVKQQHADVSYIARELKS